MSYNCLECNEEFSSERSLHAHIKKHGIFLHDYFVKHFSRRNLLTNELLPFKDKNSYFKRDFNSIDQLYQWCELADEETARNYTRFLLEQRIIDCELVNAPNEIELFTSFLPSLNIYRRLFKSYNYLCESLNIKPLFSEKLPDNFWENEKVNNLIIITDTREQEPLYFKKQIVDKLDIGDYGIIDGFDYTFVDRKSEQDFKGTLSQGNLDRFEKELIRTRSLNCYLFIVVEDDLYSLEDQNKKSYHKSNMKYIFHNMRTLQHKYKDCTQFIFTGSRTNSENLIPLLLHWGKKVWNVDMQHFINKKYGLGFRTTKK
jgi:hypothetical protein